MTDLDERLRAHSAQQALSPDSVQDLLTMHAAAGERDASPPDIPQAWYSPWHRFMRIVSLAGSMPKPLRLALSAAFVCTLALVLYRSGVQSGERAGSYAELGERTMREVAMNHRTRLDMDYQDTTLAALDQQMALLPFALETPVRLDGDLQVIGSRYCTLAGHLAAHVKFIDGGKPVSLFVTSLSRDVERLNGAATDIAGLDVQLWQEEGLFYAMARHD